MRRIFRWRLDRHKKSGKPIVFIDESGFAHGMPRTHGYALKGKRCYGIHDWGAKGRTNAIGALVGKAFLTVALFSANINTDIFTQWVKQDLLPKLPPGCVIVMDNAAFHKGKDMKKDIENENHILEYLPPYSPDLNPIEKKWAQEKRIRKNKQCSIKQLFQKHCA